MAPSYQGLFHLNPWAGPPYGYLNEEDLNHALPVAKGGTYKYSSSDSSIVAKYIMQPFWNGLLNYVVPLSIAPNMITFIGFLFCITQYAAVVYHAPFIGDGANVPDWVFILAGAFILIYQTLDALDGKQARRTGSSSALGELFDHGCDSLSTQLISLTCLTALSEKDCFNCMVYIAIASVGFFLAQWEEVTTGHLNLGLVNGPTEGILIIGSVIIFRGCVGPNLWDMPLVALCTSQVGAPVAAALTSVGLSTLRRVIFAIVYSAATFTYLGNFKNAYSAPSNRHRSLLPIILCIAPYFAVAHWHPDNYSAHQAVVLNAMGLVCAYTTSRMCVHRIAAKESLPVLTIPLVLSAVSVAAVAFLPASDLSGETFGRFFVRASVYIYVPCRCFWGFCTLQGGMIVFLSLAYFHMAASVTSQLCDKFNIYAFFLGKPKME